jgi:hypothetical protein
VSLGLRIWNVLRKGAERERIVTGTRLTRKGMAKKSKTGKKEKKLKAGKKLEKKTTLKAVEMLTPRLPV